MLEMKITITAEDAVISAINNLAKSLGQAGTQSVTAEAEQATDNAEIRPHAETAVPTAAPKYTLEMIANAGSALIDAGKLNQLMELLGKFGVESLTDLDPESYGAIATELRALGAAI